MDPLKAAILYIVDEYQGIKATELAVRIFEQGLDLSKYDSSKMLDVLNELIEAGELVEINYILPTMTYRTKSFLLPKGTTASVHAVKEPETRSPIQIFQDEDR